MRQKIGRKIYDTEKAARIGHVAEGDFGQSHGYEETLYRRKDGEYFLEGVGGADSPYPEACLVPVEEADAKDWVTRVLGADAAAELFAKKAPKRKKKS